MSSKPLPPKRECCPSSSCADANRREFFKLLGLGAATATAVGLPIMAGPFTLADFEKLVPADKKLNPGWIQSLYSRGTPTFFRGAELDRIGMPVGGLCAGQVYLGGDGKLWHWDIFNQHIGTGAAHYAQPMRPASPLEQGFALRIQRGDKTEIRALDRKGFADVSFRGEYPIGLVEYRDSACPLTVSLEAFSPFIPLNEDDSSLPATILQFTVKNTGPAKVEAELAGWLENAICLHSGKMTEGFHHNKIVAGDGMTILELSAGPPGQPIQAERPPIVFADFEAEDYGAWKAEGEAFGSGPAAGAPDTVQWLSGFQGKRLVNTWRKSDAPQGKLTSPEFTIERPFISFLIGGGNHPGQTCINLLVGGKAVRSSTGKNTDAMEWDNWNVKEFSGKTARIEILDRHSGGWGHIDIDQIEFRDRARAPAKKFEEQSDYGTMNLVLLEKKEGDRAVAGFPEGPLPQAVFAPSAAPSEKAQAALRGKLLGTLGRKLALAPGEKTQVTFAITWHFPNLSLGQGKEGRYYAKRFPSATEVSKYLAANFDRLTTQTRLWRDTWYNSTLPYWFLDRTMLNTSILATSTCHRFADGRFYGWEGVGCCEGTCTHVWQYAQAVARLFPRLERDLRERTDFGLAFQPDSGVIRFRAEGAGLAIDGQSGCILRSLREHQISPNGEFLKRNWPKIKKAVQCLIRQDGNGDGILEGGQHNTLDTDWYGPVAWLSGLYLAALRASEVMATEVGDAAFAAEAKSIFEKGRKNLVARLFNGEYFINQPDPRRPETINSGSGCEIDQVLGQSWAFQVGLGRVFPGKETLSALKSLWKYNFTPDVGPYRKAHPPGRWYAMAGEAGLLMCAFPRPDWNYDKAKGKGPDWAAGYLNECMTGFEYQAAGHMIWEGMVQEGLAITRAIHDRYHASRRNPWNEVECGDHYARAMASYGVFLACCGFEYHGPQGRLAFAPRLTPEHFRAAFTTAEGWGTFEQKQEPGAQVKSLWVRWGTVRLRSLEFPLEPGTEKKKVTVMVEGKPVDFTHAAKEGKIILSLNGLNLTAGQKLEVRIG